MALTYEIFTSPIGEILVAGDDFAVTYVRRGADKNILSADFQTQHNEATPSCVPYIREASSVLAAYLTGRVTEIGLNVRMEGTDFNRAVWAALRGIPYGGTRSYSEIAHAIGSPNAFRAVANACANNPVPLIVPCHRVVHKNGGAVGFGWGPDAKRYLLGMERQYAALMEEQTA